MAVLRDVYLIGMASAAVAVLVYGLIRSKSHLAWNYQGNVLARPYNVLDGMAVLLLLVIIGSSFFAPGGESGAATRATEDPDGPNTVGILASMLFMLVICTFIIVYLRLFRDLHPPELFGLRHMPVHHALLWGFLAIVVTYAVVFLVASLKDGISQDQSPQETVDSFRKTTDWGFRILMGFMAIVIAPVTEELIFRGFVYGVAKRFTDRWFATIFSAVMFAIVHFHVGTAPELFVLGLGFAVAYEQTGSLLVPVFMHMFFNAWNIFLMAAAAAFS
ncbi:CAAX prenyl protease-like protein [Roseimicrobium gellanilyticum]|uniref:CAAX prenyl protease-like protein n=2 Tax=Roseimicrobium gellanilyticum TaxID=748857 RepID=A0A366HR56_9BACT|nr:CAAX prenyl protease-like protein [Roseimicrobium gellanilyticum]